MNTLKSTIKMSILSAALMLAVSPGQFAFAQDTLLISYQGMLTDAIEEPVTGSPAITFTIYTAGGVSKWAEEHPSVSVIDGLFSVILGSHTALSDSVFNGEDRYLGISVDGDEEIDPRTLLTSSPGAAVSRRVVGDIRTAPGILQVPSPNDCVPPDPCEPALEMVAEPDKNIIRVHPPDPCVPPEPCGPAFEVVASAESHSIKLYPPGVSIPGIDMTSQVPGSRILLNGTELSPGGLCEVRWETDSELGKSYVHLAADSLTEVKLINGDLIGSPAILIRSAPETGGQIGINTDSPAEALEVVGNAHIEGNLTWQAKTSYVAISAAAFGPYQSGIEYLNFGQSLEKTGGGASVFFHAHVQLPQGAEVDRMTCYWEDGTIDNGQFTLYRSHLIDGSADVMGLAETSGESGNGSSYDDSIEYSPVDNSQYAYFMRARLYSDMALYGIVVEYRFTEPY